MGVFLHGAGAGGKGLALTYVAGSMHIPVVIISEESEVWRTRVAGLAQAPHLRIGCRGP